MQISETTSLENVKKSIDVLNAQLAMYSAVRTGTRGAFPKEYKDFELYDYVAANNAAIEVLIQSMHAEGWIPCEERMPAERDWYLGVFQERSTGYQLIPRVCDNIGKITSGTTSDGWGIIDMEESEYLKDLKCVAWMPLPDKYLPKSMREGE